MNGPVGFGGSAVSLLGLEQMLCVVVTQALSSDEVPNFSSHLRLSFPSFALNLAHDRCVLTADMTRACPLESTLSLEDVAGTLAPLRGAKIVATTVAGFGAGDIEVSADRLAVDFGDMRVDAGDRIEIRVDFAISREEAQTLALFCGAALGGGGSVDAAGFSCVGRIGRLGSGGRLPCRRRGARSRPLRRRGRRVRARR